MPAFTPSVTIHTYLDDEASVRTFYDPFAAAEHIHKYSKNIAARLEYDSQNEKDTVTKCIKATMQYTMREYTKNPSADNFEKLESVMRVYQSVVKNTEVSRY